VLPLGFSKRGSARKPARRTKCVKCDGHKPFLSRNDIIADYLKFNTWIDDCLGLTPSVDREPYSKFNPVRVQQLLDEISAENGKAVS
jgi:hypothetical protein